jgi:glycosyltransferase involved in cell wall biosynthesis
MAAGTPIVATSVGGVTDAVSQAEAWIVPAEDAVAMALAISESLADPADAHTRAARATRRLTEYSMDLFLDRHERVYTALAGA